jgi:hypothetical protein
MKMKTSVKREAGAVTNQGYGEVMTYRHMDCEHHTVHGFMINIVTHQYDHTSSDYMPDPFNASAITEASRDLATIFSKYVAQD